MFDQLSKFMHRPKDNDEFASICTRCFATVGSARSERDLAEFEKRHLCNKDVLFRLGIPAD